MGIGSKVKVLYPAIFFDRDGVVNRAVVRDGKPYPPSSLSELDLIEGISELIDSVKELGYKVFIFTNQPDVARGVTDRKEVIKIHDYLLRELGMDGIYCCFHDDKDLCDCRKPKPGMILQAEKEWSIDLRRSFVVGDRWRDIAAAKAANVRSILIDYQYKEQKAAPDYSCSNLKEVFAIIKTNR